jgi:hypothetical protein
MIIERKHGEFLHRTDIDLVARLLQVKRDQFNDTAEVWSDSGRQDNQYRQHEYRRNENSVIYSH